MIVAFCCNDDHGNFAGRVTEIDIPDEIRIACQKKRGPTMQLLPTFGLVKVGRVSFACGKWRDWFGNIFWNATTMHRTSVRGLVAHLLRNGWSVEEWSDGPFADLVPK